MALVGIPRRRDRPWSELFLGDAYRHEVALLFLSLSLSLTVTFHVLHDIVCVAYTGCLVTHYLHSVIPHEKLS